MKRVTNTSLLLSAFLCGAVSMQAASGETAILNITDSTSKSYGTYKGISIYDVHDTQNGGTATQITLGGSTVTVTLETGAGAARRYLGTTNSWNLDKGLPPGINLGVNTTDTSSLLSEGAYIAGNLSGFPGVITLSFSGLSKGTYGLSALMAKLSGDLSPTSFSLTLNDTNITPPATGYSYVTSGSSSGWKVVDTSSTFSAVANGTPGANYIDFSYIQVTEDNSRLVLKLTGNPAEANSQNHKSLQFVTLTYVPEPSTATLSLLALAGLAVRRRRRTV